jgi:hypothetical protein
MVVTVHAATVARRHVSISLIAKHAQGSAGGQMTLEIEHILVESRAAMAASFWDLGSKFILAW